jgi:hypothetical protein
VRALEPFPRSVRTLDAIHLASIDFLQKHGQTVYLSLNRFVAPGGAIDAVKVASARGANLGVHSVKQMIKA